MSMRSTSKQFHNKNSMNRSVVVRVQVGVKCLNREQERFRKINNQNKQYWNNNVNRIIQNMNKYKTMIDESLNG